MITRGVTNITSEKFRENFDVFASTWPQVAPQISEIASEKLVVAVEENMIYGLHFLGLTQTNSKNSSLPPSKDSLNNKNNTSKEPDSQIKRKPGGQPNHPGPSQPF